MLPKLPRTQKLLKATLFHVCLDVADGSVRVGEGFDIYTYDENDNSDGDTCHPTQDLMVDGKMLYANNSRHHGDAEQEPICT